jgi:hypothetical protein
MKFAAEEAKSKLNRICEEQGRVCTAEESLFRNLCYSFSRLYRRERTHQQAKTYEKILVHILKLLDSGYPGSLGSQPQLAYKTYHSFRSFFSSFQYLYEIPNYSPSLLFSSLLFCDYVLSSPYVYTNSLTTRHTSIRKSWQ